MHKEGIAVESTIVATHTTTPPRTLEEMFEKSSLILHLESLRGSHNPLSQQIDKLSDEQILDHKVGLFARRVTSLVNDIVDNILELGWFIDQGRKQQLYVHAGCDSMEDWLGRGLHISSDVRRIAEAKYAAYLEVKDYGITAERISNADPIQVARIGALKAEGKKQYGDIIKRHTNGRSSRDMDNNEIEAIKRKANDEFNTMMFTQANVILDTDPSELHAEIAQTGARIDKPLFILETVKIDEITGRITGHFTCEPNPNQLIALQQERYRIMFKDSEKPGLVSAKEYARKIAEIL